MIPKRNSYHLIRLNAALQYNLYRSKRSGFRIFLHASGTPSFQFRKNYSNSKAGFFNSHGKWQLAFFSLEAMGGPGFSIRDTDISFYYRMYNNRRVDRILFYKPWQIPEDYEERNLFKVGVMVATPLPKLKWLKKKKEGD